MKNLGIKSAAVSVTMAVLTGAILLGVHVASGVDAPAQSPSTAGNVGPTFSGVKISGSSNPDPDDDETVLSTANDGTTHSSRESLNIRTQHGYVEIGPKNTSWVHFYTNIGRFIFNKPVYAIGGKFGSHSANLELQTNSTGAADDYITRMTIDQNNGNVGIAGELYNFSGSVLKINDDIDVETIKNTKLLIGLDQPVEIDDDLGVTGGMKVMNGINTTSIRNAVDATNTPLRLTDADGVDIAGPLIVDGVISDPFSYLTINDDVTVNMGLTALAQLVANTYLKAPELRVETITNPSTSAPTYVKIDDTLKITGDISNPNTSGTTYLKVDDDLGVTGAVTASRFGTLHNVVGTWTTISATSLGTASQVCPSGELIVACAAYTGYCSAGGSDPNTCTISASKYVTLTRLFTNIPDATCYTTAYNSSASNKFVEAVATCWDPDA